MSEKDKAFRSLTLENERKTTLPPILKRYNSPTSNSNYSESKKKLNIDSLSNKYKNSSYFNTDNKYNYKCPYLYNDGIFHNNINLLFTSASNEYENKTIEEKLINAKKKDYSYKVLKIHQKEHNDFSIPRSTNDNKVKKNFKLASACSNYSKKTDFNIKKTSDNKSKNNVDYFYKSIFATKPIVKSKFDKYIDNKLNLLYAENLQQFKLIMDRKNKLEKNNKFLSSNESDECEKIKKQVNDIKNKINFMKSIMDYSTPHFLLTKAKAIVKKVHREDTDEILSTPVEKREHEARKKNELRTNYFTSSMKIKPLKKI